MLARVELSAPPRPSRTCTTPACPAHRPARTPSAPVHGIRTALAYLRMAQSLESIRREDVIETIRRPSRGIAPKVQEMLTKRSTTSLADIRRLAGWLTGRDVSSCRTTGLDRVGGASEPEVHCGCAEGHSGASRPRYDDGLPRRIGRSGRPFHAPGRPLGAGVVGVPAPRSGDIRGVAQGAPQQGLVRGACPVHVSTIHKIKGREGDTSSSRASKGLLPHRLEDDIEGERRVFHVALHTAVRQIVFMSDRNEPSPFLDELEEAVPTARSLRERPLMEVARPPADDVGHASAKGRAQAARPTPIERRAPNGTLA